MFNAFLVEKGSARGCWGVIFYRSFYGWVAIFDPDTLTVHAIDRIEIILRAGIIECPDIDCASVHTESPEPYLKYGIKHDDKNKGTIFVLKEKF